MWIFGGKTDSGSGLSRSVPSVRCRTMGATMRRIANHVDAVFVMWCSGLDTGRGTS